MKQIVKWPFYVLGAAFVVGFLFFFIKGIFFDWSGSTHRDVVGTFYDSLDQNARILESKDFKTSEDCQAWGNSLFDNYANYEDAYFTCGVDCEYEDQSIVSGKQIKTYRCKQIDSFDRNSQNQPEPKTEFTSQKGVNIIVYTPIENQEVENPVEIFGKVPGNWSFEATFPIEVTDSNNYILGSGYATLQDDWMTDELVTFSAVITLDDDPKTNTGFLILKKDNPSGLSENDDSLTIPIKFKQN